MTKNVLCGCGCGEYALPGNRFINGHNSSVRTHSPKTIRKMRRSQRLRRSAMTVEERFWSYVDKLGPTMPHMKTRCWMWTGALWGRGYGCAYDGHRQLPAHRLAWEFENGPMPKGKQGLHKCDNPTCVRPSHVFPGTHLENMHDMISKGRDRYAGRTKGIRDQPGKAR